jgi:drug/metabolite transporter (DMT)-like permease
MSIALPPPAPPPAAHGFIVVPQASLAIATLLWAGNFIVGRALRDEIGPLELNFWRWSIALAVLLPFTVQDLRRQWSMLRRHMGLVLGLGLTGVMVPHTCIYAALRTTTAVNALLLLSLTPVLILMGARILYGQAIRRSQWLGMALSMSGAVVLIVHGSVDTVLRLEFGRGDLWMLPAVVAAAAQVLLLKRTPAGVQQAPLLTASVIAALALMLPGVWIFGDLALPSGGRMVASLGYIGVLASALAFVLWNHGASRVGPSRAAPYLFLMPVYGSILSLVILGEGVARYQYAGGALVLLGLWLARPQTPTPTSS